MSNTFGRLLRMTTYGESHGAAIGVVIDGVPPGVPLALADIQHELDRRRPGAGPHTTPRHESDAVQCDSGVFAGLTLGTSIGLRIANADAQSDAYAAFADCYRPSHADYTYEARYGRRDWRGGGRSSGRETAARVAAGAVARAVLASLSEIDVLGFVRQVGPVRTAVPAEDVTRAAVEAEPLRCPDPVAAAAMARLLDEARADGDSLGSVVEVVARGVPAGLGAPVFGKLEADLAAALLSIPGTRGFELGDGFALSALRGSAANDPFVATAGTIRTSSNRSGGVQGGISNGMPIVVRAAFRPPASIARPQQTVRRDGTPTVLTVTGRHDPCIGWRAVPVVEAMVAFVLCDHLLLWRGQCGRAAR